LPHYLDAEVFFPEAEFEEKFAETAQAIAAHLGFASICVENPHSKVRFDGIFQKDDPVGSDPQASPA
jgi:hypothetical protein